ncbi:MAG: hypothetical protein JWO56_3733 [Acidobacteria bacterium]|nr:hypothetical protein [Acidobacteriota bacterium]
MDRRLAGPLTFAACVAAAGAASLALGQDANWDLRNYHYYNAWALLNGRWAIDVVPAQVQTFYNPVADLPFYFLAGILPARGVALVMAIPVAISAFFLVRIADLLFAKPEGAGRLVLIAAAVAIGVTGAAGVAVIGSTMNEWHSTAFVMAALYLALRGKRLGWAGFLMGCAAGLKLAYAPYAVGLAVAMISYGTPRERVRRGACVGAFLFLGWLATAGAWSAFLWIRYGDPVFPYLNGIFRSDQWQPMSFRDSRYGPRTVLQWLAFPLYFSRGGHALVGEVGFRDYRLATLWVLGVAALAWLIVRGRPRPGAIPVPWKIVVVFALVSYVAWLAVFSYYRYAVPLEMLSGPLICGAVAFAFRKRAAAGMTALLILATLLVGTTRKMGWERVAFGAKYFEVTVPTVDEGALVVMAGDAAMAYAAPFFRTGTRFVSPSNNLLRIGQDSRLAHRAAEAIGGHRGPLYILDPAVESTQSRSVLRHFGLLRGPCEPIRSNIDYDALRVCKLAAESGR